MEDDVRRLALIGVQSEIARLVALRAQLEAPTARKVGRPKNSTAVTQGGTSTSPRSVRTRRKMSPAGRKRISDMMKKRWAERKKASK